MTMLVLLLRAVDWLLCVSLLLMLPAWSSRRREKNVEGCVVDVKHKLLCYLWACRKQVAESRHWFCCWYIPQAQAHVRIYRKHTCVYLYWLRYVCMYIYICTLNCCDCCCHSCPCCNFSILHFVKFHFPPKHTIFIPFFYWHHRNASKCVDTDTCVDTWSGKPLQTLHFCICISAQVATHTYISAHIHICFFLCYF